MGIETELLNTENLLQKTSREEMLEEIDKLDKEIDDDLQTLKILKQLQEQIA